MENEYQILAHLQQNEITTQRKISQRTGLSLGAVNILIKKMIRKGLIKVEQLNSRTMRYILTPQGIKEKTRLTYEYVRTSYRQIKGITSAVETLLAAEKSINDYDQVILFGPPDEIEQILKNTLTNAGIKFQVKRPENGAIRPEPNQIIFTWRSGDEEALGHTQRGFNIMNLVE